MGKKMKKTLTLLAGLCMGALCFGQKLSDTEVQVIAYWDKGDVMVYDFSEKKTTTVNGEEVSSNSASEKHVFEITGATEKSYVVRFSYEDILNYPVIPGAFGEVAERIMDNMWFETLTDELGTVQELTNMEGAFEALRARIPVMTDRVLSKYTAEELQEEGVSRDMLVQSFTAGLCQEAFLEKICLKNVSPLFLYHGARFNLDQEYTVPQNLIEVLGDGDLEVDWKFWAASSECTEDYVVIHAYAEAGKEALKPLLRDLMMESDPELSQADMEEMLGETDARLEHYSTIVVHLASGWPIQWYEKRIVTLDDGDTTVISHEKELKYSEEDPRNA